MRCTIDIRCKFVCMIYALNTTVDNAWICDNWIIEILFQLLNFHWNPLALHDAHIHSLHNAANHIIYASRRCAGLSGCVRKWNWIMARDVWKMAATWITTISEQQLKSHSLRLSKVIFALPLSYFDECLEFWSLLCSIFRRRIGCAPIFIKEWDNGI